MNGWDVTSIIGRSGSRMCKVHYQEVMDNGEATSWLPMQSPLSFSQAVMMA